MHNNLFILKDSPHFLPDPMRICIILFKYAPLILRLVASQSSAADTFQEDTETQLFSRVDGKRCVVMVTARLFEQE